jgi:ABC-type glycerol-3-phosphate transport system permease component
MDTYEFALTIAALPITVILLFLAAFIVRRENYPGHTFIIFLYFAGMAYFIFKLIRMYDSSKAEFYKPARHSLTTFSVLAILLLVITIATAIECMRNFNKGLRPHIQRRKVPDVGDTKYSGGYTGDEYAGQGQQHQLGAVPSRMTID